MADNFKKTLILPLISTGNVPQLTTDLILHSLSNEFRFVKSLDSTYVHPFVGALDYSLNDGEPILYKSYPDKKFSSALELFYNDSKNLYVIQQRTPIIQGYINNFIKEIVIPVIEELRITDVTILDSYGALDESIINHKFNNNTNIGVNNVDPFYSIGVCKLEGIGSLSDEFDSVLNLKTDPNTAMHYTNSLLEFSQRSLLQEISTDQQIFKIIFHLINSQLGSLMNVKYCSFFVHEGDNSLDAKLFTSHFSDFVNPKNSSITEIKDFKTPISWKGVYGFNEVPATLEEGIYI
ncbi:similar to Saccharomyces cerevisiae YKL206C ADD66 Protein involved in 20S proteasome assembly [Maudiozyma barnettii]|uniref:Proteasome assembly chaperone 2 n=1 Tax=Maudiozyma barnettii TaxID=61262 RepID=A0A8H2VFM3_9SACH|nr:Add66p [Kazachstania barnettii]CAB4254637.1 similar to Saccharomyces cerevisiae YKL206C ADD66 Protein involved in 20S proteasome assembly [Kazachstania barnettii]CAD1782679.1 similar to Saccharomyces cerevisiae YKL206C ADD66 Protein involved in 20S proteasome assembly [Kazachstania barnettii]